MRGTFSIKKIVNKTGTDHIPIQHTWKKEIQQDRSIDSESK